MHIANCRNDLEDTVVDRQERHIEGTSGQIVHETVLRNLLVQNIGDVCGNRLIDDLQDVEARDGASILGGLSPGVVEVHQER